MTALGGIMWLVVEIAGAAELSLDARIYARRLRADNANYVTVASSCAARLGAPPTRTLSLAEARVVSDLGRAARLDELLVARSRLPTRLEEIRDKGARARGLELQNQIGELGRAYPRVRLTADGRIVRFDRDFGPKLRLGRMSDDGRWYVVRSVEANGPLRILERATGRVVYEGLRVPTSDVTFATSQPTAVVHRPNSIELIPLEQTHSEVRHYRTFPSSGEVYFDPPGGRLVACLRGVAPAILKLWGPPWSRSLALELDHAEARSRVPGAGYAGRGLVSATRRTLVTRVTSVIHPQTDLEIFDLDDRRLRGVVRIAARVVEIGLSPDDRYLAAQLTNDGAILIYDLRTSLAVPRWELSLPPTFGEQLVFTPDGALLVNSESRGTVVRFDLPR